MDDDLKQKTANVAKLYFDGFPDERPFELWRAFDKKMAKDLSTFITGQVYSEGENSAYDSAACNDCSSHCFGKTRELKLHIYAALNVNCNPHDIAEVIFQCGIYGGMPVVNQGLKILRLVLQERGSWPLDQD